MDGLEIKRDDPFFWKEALLGMIMNGVSVNNADWTEWCIQVCYRYAGIPEEEWPDDDLNLNWEPLFGPNDSITPTRQLGFMISGIGLAMDELGLDTSFFPATRYIIQTIPDDWFTFRSVVTTTCTDIVVSWLSAIVTSWIIDPQYIQILVLQDIRKIASTLLLAELEPDYSITFAERMEQIPHLDFTMIAVSHACAIHEAYISNFYIGEKVDLNKTGYLYTEYSHTWMPIENIERALRITILVRKICSRKIQRAWRKYRTIRVLRSMSYLLFIKSGHSNLSRQTGCHLLTHKFEHDVDL
jgi:hypothetical protein